VRNQSSRNSLPIRMAREKEKQEKTKEEHFGVTAASAARIFF
jgi:hypothetical protein